MRSTEFIDGEHSCNQLFDLTALVVTITLIVYTTFLIMTKWGERVLVNQLLKKE
jgi:hypothetical protein